MSVLTSLSWRLASERISSGAAVSDCQSHRPLKRFEEESEHGCHLYRHFVIPVTSSERPWSIHEDKNYSYRILTNVLGLASGTSEQSLRPSPASPFRCLTSGAFDSISYIFQNLPCVLFLLSTTGSSLKSLELPEHRRAFCPSLNFVPLAGPASTSTLTILRLQRVMGRKGTTFYIVIGTALGRLSVNMQVEELSSCHRPCLCGCQF